MKRVLGIVAGLMLAAGMVSAQTNVLSQNAVGYVKVTVAYNSLYLVTVPYLQIDGSGNTLENIFGDQLPDFSTVHLWNGAGYDSHLYLGGGAFTTPGVAIPQSAGLWIDTSTAPPGADVDVFILGEVPGSNNGSDTNTVTGLPGSGIELVGFPYPVTADLATAGLIGTLPDFTTIHQWTGGSYASALYLGGGAFTGPVVVAPGEGFWLDTTTALPGGAWDWTETKPYAYP